MKLFNTMSREVENIKPLNEKTIKFYNCGITVYSQPHIGNWVGYIYWDVLQRTLEAEGFSVDRVQNITDVGHLVSDDDDGEDKMEKGAKAEGITAWDVAEKYIKIADDEAFNKLKLLKPKLIRATDCIEEQIEFVKILEDKGFTYKIKDEGIYFDTSKLNNYGKLARLDIKGLEAGARVDIKGKKNITDFALWKFSPANKKRDMEWDSPWGKGFPGWHLECSVIARLGLGDQIDIHAGGVDHIPVHHTNEIAQTESVTGKDFSQFWIHNNHLKVDGSKMAKSVGNIYTLKDLESHGFSFDDFKLLVLSKHYRTEGNFTWKIIESAHNRLANWKAQADKIWQIDESDEDISKDILESLSEDLNTPLALSLIDKYFDKVAIKNNSPNKRTLKSIENLLGLNIIGSDISKDTKELLSKRQLARDESNWAESDKLRDTLREKGFIVEDTPSGQIWSRV